MVAGIGANRKRGATKQIRRRGIVKFTTDVPKESGYYVCKPIYPSLHNSDYTRSIPKYSVAQVKVKEDSTEVTFSWEKHKFVYHIGNPTLGLIEWGEKVEGIDGI
jgi:hypothetical protein